MPDLEIIPLLAAVSVCLGLAVIGNVWSGDALKSWYRRLIKPRLQVPLWAFIMVGVLVYIVEGIVIYRLLAMVAPPQSKVVALTALLVVMAYNEAWNIAFFGMKNLLATLVATVCFLAPLAILMVALFAYDSTSGWLLAPYCLWVGYDLWWVNQLWRLNPNGAA